MNRSQIHSASRAVAPHKCKCTLYNWCCTNLNTLKTCKIKHILFQHVTMLPYWMEKYGYVAEASVEQTTDINFDKPASFPRIANYMAKLIENEPVYELELWLALMEYCSKNADIIKEREATQQVLVSKIHEALEVQNTAARLERIVKENFNQTLYTTVIEWLTVIS